ncbi:MAG TPA: SDR family NAD(P)-dependent oxidoreductase [Methanobacterium sp.]|nr:SDR family NAD(P)-dependent oxidoreductase [Methanobacterium sp.]
MKISGNTILITGGATGIGYELAKQFLEAGNEVIICGRREDRLIEAQKNLPELHIKVCDVANENDRNKLFNWVKNNFSNLNILINNAGIQRDVDFTKGTEDLLNCEDEIKINLEAPIFLSALFIPFLKGKEGAAIINVSSGLAFTPLARVPIYCATKAALHSFSLTLRYQLRNTGINIFEVIPPIVDTELNKEGREKIEFKADLKPDEFVSAVMEGLEKDKFEIGYQMSEMGRNSSREDLDMIFQRMNPK